MTSIDLGMVTLLGIHVAAGLVALLAGAVAIFSIKGSQRHNTAGKAYVVAMGIVVVTAVPLSLAIASWFLLAIAMFSGYLVFAGRRVISRRRSGVAKLELVDWIGHGGMLVVGIAMVLAGVYDTIVRSGLGPVLVVFGVIGVALAIRELRTLAHPANERVAWYVRHIGFMGGAYIATITAAITVNLTMVPPLVRWIGPTAIGVPCILYATRKYDARYTPPSRRGTDGAQPVPERPRHEANQ